MSTGEHDGASRDVAGRWVSGKSPNPAGRPPNSERVRQLLQPHQEQLIAKAVEMALAGDSAALKICLDRIAPMLKSEAPAVTIPGLAEAAGITEKMDAVMRAVASGNVSPDAGGRVFSIIETYRRVFEMTELEQRLRVLEDRAK